MTVKEFTNEKYNEKCFLIILLGTIEALIKKSITVDECQSILPLSAAEENHFDSRIQNIIERCYELEDFDGSQRNEYENSLIELKESTMALLSEYADYSKINWMQ
ncbi:DUF3969 family protein [Treponema zioleckii]|uniref:DUF3969 family protein n=1 Tax=Treponema zioleckii TaxID=331680 RepID=UPI00168B15B9|nr:DUF3969 family protein [Treponema zioleckii]